MNRLGLESAIPVLERNDVEFAGVFGSFAKGVEHEDSDVDILIRFKKPKSLIKIVGLEMELSEVLGKKVDLVTEGGLCPHIKDSVLGTLLPFYGHR